MDVIALHRAGFGHAVAPLGTALTQQQIQELWRVVPEPILCFDGDSAGQKAAARAVETALPVIRSGRGLRFAVLPESEDPDSLIAHDGAGAMREVLDRSERLSDVLWRLETAQHPVDTPEGLATLRQHFEEHARRIGDSTFREYFLKWFRDRIWQAGRTRPERGAMSRKRAAGVASPNEARVHVDSRSIHEQLLVVALMTHPELYDEVGERLGLLDLTDSRLDNLRQEVLKTLAAESALDSSGLQRHLCEHGFSEDVDRLLSRSVLFYGRFAKPDAPTHETREGWEHVYAWLSREGLKNEVSDGWRQLGKEMTSETFDRARALHLQHQTSHLADDAEAGQPLARGVAEDE